MYLLAKYVQCEVVHIAVVNKRAGIRVRMRNAHFALAGARAQPLVNAPPHVGMFGQRLVDNSSFFRGRRLVSASDGFFGRRRQRSLLLRQLGPARIPDVIVEELHLLFDGVHLVGELVEDVLLDKLQGFELFAGEGAEPLVLG